MFEEFKLTKDLPEKFGYYVFSNNLRAYKEPILIHIKNEDDLEFWRKYGGCFSKCVKITENETASEQSEQQIKKSKLEQLLREIRYAYSEGFRACQFTEVREEDLFACSIAAKVIDNYGKEFNIETKKIA